VSGSSSLYERLGGQVALQGIVEDFVGRVTGDMMIGFFFRAVDHARLTELEVQFAAAHLGGPSKYEGRPLSVAHSPHRIMGGQFNRRLRILDQTLRDHGVEEDIRAAWLHHNEQLRSQITRDRADECGETALPRGAAPLGNGATPEDDQASEQAAPTDSK
jgi:hemoglobin